MPSHNASDWITPREECPVLSARPVTRIEVALFETCSASSVVGRKYWPVRGLASRRISDIVKLRTFILDRGGRGLFWI
jgi:hypothetical protein